MDIKYVFGYNRFPAQFIVANFDVRRKYTPGPPGVFFMQCGPKSSTHVYWTFYNFLFREPTARAKFGGDWISATVTDFRPRPVKDCIYAYRDRYQNPHGTNKQ